ncbi:delta-like protein C [Gigantopelta aegis]|uniref:delta-like protein C n=1 Tax=Gigantopelta aegis TaxID=1735272 RepID=UPI001B889A85|nr:delta-like protein C [Gigantopelta aegis]
MPTTIWRLALCIVALAGIHCGPFHCHRPNQNCHQSGTCNANGTCTCPTHLEGDDCSIVKANINAQGCNALTCKNGGVCVKKGNSVVCACSVNYYGTDCSQERYQIKCSTSEIIFNINPVGLFEGFAFVADRLNVSACRSSPVPSPPIDDDGIPDTWEGHVLRLKFDNSICGKIDPVQDKDMFTYKKTIRIQYRQALSTVTDDVLVGVCSSNSVVVVRSQFMVLDEVLTTTTTQAPSAAATIQGSFIPYETAALITWLNLCLPIGRRF